MREQSRNSLYLAFLKCDEHFKIVGECPKCKGHLAGYKYSSEPFKGQVKLFCAKNCGFVFEGSEEELSLMIEPDD